MGQNEQIDFIVNHLTDTWSDFTKLILSNPQKLIHSQSNYWQEYYDLFLNNISNKSHDSDRRFQYKEWQNNLAYEYIKKSYLLVTTHLKKLINDLEIQDEYTDKRMKFFIRQVLDAISPTNFVNTNPEVIYKILETDGENLLTGLKQFVEDFEYGKLSIKMSDENAFKIGENIACTKGKVVYQNHLMQLIQYEPTTKKVYQYPLLIIPPWINKYYILDLQEENSFAKWLVDQGITVFMISWVNPTSQHRETQFEDYMLHGPLAAFDVIKENTRQDQLNLLGYCIGGTLLSCLLAYLAKKNDSRILSATYLTTLLDFSEPGELGTFIDEKQIPVLEAYMQKNGYLDGHIMATVFNALRANDLIWSTFVNNYLKGQAPKAFDLLYWNADPTNIPEKVHSYYLRNMYLKNRLIKPDQVTMNNIPLDLGKISVPSYFLAAQDDHIVPWKSVYKGKEFVGGKINFVLTSSGHVAGVINPPHKNKYGYWTNRNTTKNPDQYLEGAKYQAGSWWSDWINWLKPFAGELLEARKINNKSIIADAPGSYVKVRLIKS